MDGLSSGVAGAEMGAVGTAEVRYAKTDDNAHLAYTIFGSGPIDLLEVGNGTNISFDAANDQPRWEAYVGRLGDFARVIRFDPRGIGLSDPLGGARPTVEGWADDTVAVMDSAGAAVPALIATGHAGPVAIFVAATRPERVRALVLVNTCARLLRTPDYLDGIPPHVFERFVDGLVEPGAEDSEQTDDLPLMAPSRVEDVPFRNWWRAAGHRGASPATSRAMHLMAAECDVRVMLERVQAPTLVLHSGDNQYVRATHGRFLAEHLPKATYMQMPSADHLPWTGDADFVGEMEEFLTGTRHVAPSNRRLATVVFTDIVRSTHEARRLGDGPWRERLDQHDLITDRQVSRFSGQLVKATGDGVLATFDGPARAVQCALAIHEALGQIGVTIRAGVHVGEIEQRGADIAGIAVHIAQRICSTAEPGETLVSRTITDLAAGSGIGFEDRGNHQLKGLDGTWNLFRARNDR
jgi:class 3 adenylate cyclase